MLGGDCRERPNNLRITVAPLHDLHQRDGSNRLYPNVRSGEEGFPRGDDILAKRDVERGPERAIRNYPEHSSMSFFGIGGGELFVIIIVALLVFGPGKLPELMGDAGRMLRELRRTTRDLTGDFEDSVRDIQDAYREVESDMRNTVKQIEDDTRDISKEVNTTITGATTFGGSEAKSTAAASKQSVPLDQQFDEEVPQPAAPSSTKAAQQPATGNPAPAAKVEPKTEAAHADDDLLAADDDVDDLLSADPDADEAKSTSTAGQNAAD